MKFRFLGGGDCPDWLLAALYELSGVREEKTAALCEHLAKYPNRGQVDEKALLEILTDPETNTAPPISTIKVLVSCIYYILYAAQRLDVPGDVLVGELQQLGLPRSHAIHLRKAAEHQVADADSDDFLRISRVLNVTTSSPTDERVVDCVEINLSIQDCAKETTQLQKLLIQKHDLPELINELKKVRERMDDIQI